MPAKDAGTLAAVPPEGSTGPSPGPGLPAPCPLRLCRDTGLLPALPPARLSWRQTPVVPSRRDPLRREDIPITLPAKTRSNETNPDLQKPAASRWALRAPHGSPPTCNPPGQGGITVRTGCGQSSLPSTTGRSTGSRGARRGAGRAPGGQRAGRGAGEHPRARLGSGPRPGTTCCTVGARRSNHGGKSRPAHANPPTAPVAFPLPAHGCVHRRSDRDTGRVKKGSGRKWRKREEAGRWRAGGAAAAPAPAQGAKGHPGLPTLLGCLAALPAPGCSAGDSPPGETEARGQAGSSSVPRGLCAAPPPPKPPGEGNAPPRHGRDDTSSPASSRSTLFLQEPRSPGSGQAARASLLPALPPCLLCLRRGRPGPAPALGTRIPSPVRAGLPPRACTFPRRVRATLERCRRRSVPNSPARSGDARGRAGGDGRGGQGEFFPPIYLFVGWVCGFGFFSLA